MSVHVYALAQEKMRAHVCICMNEYARKLMCTCMYLSLYLYLCMYEFVCNYYRLFAIRGVLHSWNHNIDLFVPSGSQTLRLWKTNVFQFLNDLGKDERAASFLLQRLSIAIHRGEYKLHYLFTFPQWNWRNL